MSDDSISLLERYLLEDDKERFFGTLVKNSETYVNMRLLDHINRYGLNMPADSLGTLKNYLSDSKNKRTLIQFKHRLLELQAETDASKRKSLIEKLNKDFLDVKFNYQRPANIKQSENLKAQNEIKAANSFEDDHFNFDKAMEVFFNQPDWNQIKTFQPQYFRRFDMRRLLDKKIECFEHVLNSLTSFTHIQVSTS